MSYPAIYPGSCECGECTFEVTAPLRPIINCHCIQCRKQSGHYWATTFATTDQITISGKRSLTWFQSSDCVRKGFCRLCGSSLFWMLEGRDGLSISGGAFDAPLPVKHEKHIFVAEKACYYDINDGLPQAPHYELPGAAI